MTVNNAMYASADAIHFFPMFNHSSIHHADDTKDTGIWDSNRSSYVIYVRRDIQVPNRTSGVVRWIGR